MESLYKQIANIINKSSNIVFFGGAGVSTECGIPDFRSSNGLYSQKYKHHYDPETILSHSFFNSKPEVFYEFLRSSMLMPNVSPNSGHKALAELEKQGKLQAIITQNIDGLHQMAGSENVLELHGNLSRFYCCKCGKNYSIEYVIEQFNVPMCDCGGIIRPDIVLYEEALNEDIIVNSIKYISDAEVLIVAGTSLVVYPAAGFLSYFNGDKVIFINKDSTPFDSMANIIINEPFGSTMKNIMNELGMWKA